MPITKVLFLVGLILVSALLWSRAHAEMLKLDHELTVFYEVAGAGQVPIVFIPGWTMSTKVFDKQLAHFANSTKYRFYTYDPRGQGKSTKTEGGHFYEQHGRDLHNFLERLGLKHVVLVGWSNGGFEALAYIREYGAENVRALILIDCPPKSIGNNNKTEWVWVSRDDADGSRRGLTMDTLLDRKKMDKNFVDWMLEHPTPADVTSLSAISDETPDTIAALTNETSMYEDYEQDLTSLDGKLPLLFVVREEMGGPAKKWATVHTPNATIIAFGKHLLFWERPDQFKAGLDKFLATVH